MITFQRKHLCHTLAAIFSFAFVFPVAFALFDREPPFDLTDGRTVPEYLSPGKPYQFDWMKTPVNPRECTGTVYWRIVDSQGTIWTTVPAESLFTQLDNSVAGRVVGRERALPSFIPKGPAKLHSSMDFYCNWTHYLWPIHREYPTLSAEVR